MDLWVLEGQTKGGYFSDYIFDPSVNQCNDEDDEVFGTFLSWALAIGSYFFPSFLASESSLTSTCEEEEEEEDSSSQKQEVLKEERMQE